MENRTDYEALIEEIMAIENDKAKRPHKAVDEFLQDAENLFHWGNDDIDDLMGAGLDRKYIDELPKRAGACRNAQSIWEKDKNSKEDVKKEWEEKSKLAYELKEDLLSSFGYAFRKNENLLKHVRVIRDGSGHNDLIQDMSDLSVLGKANPELLSAIKFDMLLLDKSADMAKELAPLLAIVNGNNQEGNESKIIRDKAFTHLKEAVDEVRDCGKYVFRKNKDRLKGYLDSSYKRKRRKNKNDKEEETNNNEDVN